jgi:hypothetical protein
MRERVAVALALALVLAGLVIVLSQRSQRLAGSNSQVVVSAYDLPVRAGHQLCQYNETLPAGAAALRLFVGTLGHPGSPLEITVTGTHGALSRGRVAGGYRNGPLHVPITRVARDGGEGRLCIRNRGRATMRFAGNLTPPFGGANTANARLGDVIRVDFLRPGRESWWDISPQIARRFGLVKTSFFGSWTLWFVLGLVVLSSTAAITLVLRQRR